MRTKLKPDASGIPTLYVEYQADDLDQAIDAALSAYGLRDKRVQLICVPSSAAHWLWPRGIERTPPPGHQEVQSASR